MKFNNVLKVLSAPFKIHAPGEAPVRSPNTFQSYYNLNEEPPSVKRDVAIAYTKVFCEPPWNENWKIEEVEEKIVSEINGPSCLTIMEGNSEHKVGGFSWGAVVPTEKAAHRTMEAHRFEGARIEELLSKKLSRIIKGDKVFFLDEVAVLREFRGGMSPIQFLVRPSLEVAVDAGAIEGVGWTSWRSKIAPLSLYLGFSTIVAEIEDVAFLYNPDIRPLLKIAQNVNGQTLEKIIASASRLVRRVA